MNRLHRTCIGCIAVITLALTATVNADSKLDISNWKEILPAPAFNKLVEESLKNLTSYTASASQFNQNGKRVQDEATNLIIYAEIAHQAGGFAMIDSLREDSLKLLKAAQAKKGDEAKKLTAAINEWNKTRMGASISANNNKADDIDLAKTTSFKAIMEHTVKDLDKLLTPYGRLRSEQLAAKGKSEEVQAAMYKLAALSVATTAHVPTEMPKGKTAKDWLTASEEMRKASLAAATAAKDKKQPALKKAIDDLKASCAKCHDDFRKEGN